MNKSGFSIIQVLLLGSFLSGLSMLVIKKTNSITKTLRTLYFQEEIFTVTHHLQTTLADVDLCRSVFGGVDFSGSSSGRVDQILDNLTSEINFIRPGDVLGPQNKYEVAGFDLYDDGDFATRNELLFEVNYKVLSKDQVYGGGELTRSFPIVVTTSSSAPTTIRDCFYDPEGKIRQFIANFCSSGSGRGAELRQNGAECHVYGMDLDASPCPGDQVARGVTFVDDHYVFNCQTNTYSLLGKNCGEGSYLYSIPKDTTQFSSGCHDIDQTVGRLLQVSGSGSGCRGVSYRVSGSTLSVGC